MQLGGAKGLGPGIIGSEGPMVFEEGAGQWDARLVKMRNVAPLPGLGPMTDGAQCV